MDEDEYDQYQEQVDELETAGSVAAECELLEEDGYPELARQWREIMTGRAA